MHRKCADECCCADWRRYLRLDRSNLSTARGYVSMQPSLQVLMLDADNLPLRNPEALFETREYRRSGTLFFSDWWDMTEWVKPQAYTAFGLPYPGDEAAILAAESGQLFINRQAPTLLPCCE